MNYLPYVLPLSSQGPRVTALFFFPVPTVKNDRLSRHCRLHKLVRGPDGQ